MLVYQATGADLKKNKGHKKVCAWLEKNPKILSEHACLLSR